MHFTFLTATLLLLSSVVSGAIIPREPKEPPEIARAVKADAMEVRDITEQTGKSVFSRWARNHAREFRRSDEVVAREPEPSPEPEAIVDVAARVPEPEADAKAALAERELEERVHSRDFHKAVEAVARAIEEGRDIVEINEAIAKRGTRAHARDFWSSFGEEM
jgi:hypothetical protein